MSEVLEKEIVNMIAGSFTGAALASTAPVSTVTASSPEVLFSTEGVKFEFDEDFQLKVLAHCMRDMNFMRKAGHLIRPEYFEHIGHQALANLAVKFFQNHNSVPQTRPVAFHLLKEDIAANVIRKDVAKEVIPEFKKIFDDSESDLLMSNSDWVAEKVAEFARHQAVSQAILASVTMLEKKQFGKIEQMIKAATEIGVHLDSNAYDYFANIEQRTIERLDRAAGKLPPTGITTGHQMIDDLLYHRGWGRKELTVILGGAKSGKTTALINFSKAAVLTGKNVLHCTLEVSARINAERLDATMADMLVKDLNVKIHEVKGKIEALKARSGAFMIHEYPSGTFTPNELRQLVQRYKSPGINADGTVRPPILFDMIVVDYADIMAPNYRTNDPIENSKSIYLDLRAIATEENCAVLTATQGNRDGAKATVLTGVHVADDYNKVRTVDLMISINVTDEERAHGEARLHFAASRNQEGGITIFIKQELSKMKFIASILRIE